MTARSLRRLTADELILAAKGMTPVMWAHRRACSDCSPRYWRDCQEAGAIAELAFDLRVEWNHREEQAERERIRMERDGV